MMSARTNLFNPARLMRKLAWQRLRAAAGAEPAVTVDTWNGRLTFHATDAIIGKALYVDRAYERSWIIAAARYLEQFGLRRPERDVLIDVGAHLGMITCGMLLQQIFHAAIAVEPTPVTWGLLNHNLRQNGLEERVQSCNVALSDHCGTLQLGIGTSNSSANWVLSAQEAEAASAQGGSIAVPCWTLDELLATKFPELQERIGLVWMDIEGHEAAVLAGADFIRRQSVPAVLEFHPRAIDRMGQGIEGYLETLGPLFQQFVSLGETNATPRPLNELRALHAERLKQSHSVNLLLF